MLKCLTRQYYPWVLHKRVPVSSRVLPTGTRVRQYPCYALLRAHFLCRQLPTIFLWASPPPPMLSARNFISLSPCYTTTTTATSPGGLFGDICSRRAAALCWPRRELDDYINILANRTVNLCKNWASFLIDIDRCLCRMMEWRLCGKLAS